MKRNHFCTFQAGSSNGGLHVLQFIEVYTDEDVREAFDIRSYWKEKPVVSTNINTEKLCLPRWFHLSHIKLSHVLTTRCQLENLATGDLPHSARHSFGFGTLSAQEKNGKQEHKTSICSWIFVFFSDSIDHEGKRKGKNNLFWACLFSIFWKSHSGSGELTSNVETVWYAMTRELVSDLSKCLLLSSWGRLGQRPRLWMQKQESHIGDLEKDSWSWKALVNRVAFFLGFQKRF